MLRAQVGLVDMADLLFLASDEYRVKLEEAGHSDRRERAVSCSVRKEGRIALGNRRTRATFPVCRDATSLGVPNGAAS